ncbi:biopolymer transporter ExbD [Pseudomonas sp. No.21]|uniref:Biopolymer transporter ExbD n=1 Tax=Pseudomonas solani TaxID=2731552 RepID=A0AAU7Y197_9PSED|nr:MULTISPECIES: biopolymer transporter ExbD [Pseudomonas]EQM69408.1 biopolymer transporter ExbD [Pseudomonas alcaligenes OT 69]MBB4821735.1 biopolymer transport protein ExbD [Pseudomonas alcaligenes]MDN4144126.1 biopolymer transporter ExbD [Pseudomonas tohonis]MDU9411803.1 biopolymer transporter ExbD [Pseudomonas sp. zfem005]MDW3714394.1 biopolymer transporter ExbD [Pseudomonas sp. 2023EL-01195]
MRSWDVAKKKKAHIEIIPMIDVMMFLLVFFVLVSLNVIPAVGIKTQLPTAAHAQQLKPQNKAVITLGLDEKLQLDGQDVSESLLVEQLKVLEGTAEKLVIIINSDQGVEVKRLVAVMDLLKGNGFSSVSIATRKS